jgi:hypothetical protein
MVLQARPFPKIAYLVILWLKNAPHLLQCTDHRPRDDTRGEGGRVCSVRGTSGYTGDYLIAIGRSDRPLYYFTQIGLIRLRLACSEGVHSANAFRMDCSNSTLATKSSICAYIELLPEIIIWSVNGIIVDQSECCQWKAYLVTWTFKFY